MTGFLVAGTASGVGLISYIPLHVRAAPAAAHSLVQAAERSRTLSMVTS